MRYITVQDVGNELNGMVINNSTIPSSATVESWIDQESDTLDRETGRIWGEVEVENEYQDYDGSGFIRTNKRPIVSVEDISYQTGENTWVSLTEGRYKDFIIYKDEGEIMLLNNSVRAGYQNIKISYTAGYEDTNPTVQSIIAKKVALRVIGAVINSQAGEDAGSVTVDVISISDPTTFSVNRVRSLQEDIKSMIGTLGKFKTYRYNRRWVN